MPDPGSCAFYGSEGTQAEQPIAHHQAHHVVLFAAKDFRLISRDQDVLFRRDQSHLRRRGFCACDVDFLHLRDCVRQIAVVPGAAEAEACRPAPGQAESVPLDSPAVQGSLARARSAIRELLLVLRMAIALSALSTEGPTPFSVVLESPDALEGMRPSRPPRRGGLSGVLLGQGIPGLLGARVPLRLLCQPPRLGATPPGPCGSRSRSARAFRLAAPVRDGGSLRPWVVAIRLRHAQRPLLSDAGTPACHDAIALHGIPAPSTSIVMAGGVRQAELLPLTEALQGLSSQEATSSKR
eukprot:scaffold277_cov261-Pinguiococcus_pyrenoidosus.AAC.14